MAKIIGKQKAVQAIRILDKKFNCRSGVAFFNNKRAKHRDYKWDYLDIHAAKRASAELTRLGLAHDFNRIPSRYSDGAHGQIRLAVKLDFSLDIARGRKPRAEPLTPRQRWNADMRRLRSYSKALAFGRPHHREALSEAVRVLSIIDYSED